MLGGVGVAVAAALGGCRPHAGPEPPPAPWSAERIVEPSRWRPVRARPTPAEPSPLLPWLRSALATYKEVLSEDGRDPPAYYLAFDVVGTQTLWIVAERGTLLEDDERIERSLDVDVRVGSYGFDNSRAFRDTGDGRGLGLGSGAEMTLDDEEAAVAHALWRVTDRQYRDAAAVYRDVRSNEDLRAEGTVEPDLPDFSREEPVEMLHGAPVADFSAVRAAYRDVVRNVSRVLGDGPHVLDSRVTFEMVRRERTFVSTEGTTVQGGRLRVRIVLEATGRAADGMALTRTASFEGHAPADLPDESVLQEAARGLREELAALIDAPLAEPYTGPALLDGRSAAVFFHEIVGHRLEGHRLKIDEEGQTLADKVGKRILPWFLDIEDDPTIARLGNVPLWGHYFVDDEGVPAGRTLLVQRGKLKAFLLGRSPVRSFPRSNGHGRREPGHAVVARQGNLIVRARKTLRRDQLRAELLAEVRRQKKPYGLLIREAESGYTLTDRSGPQAFKVVPTLVYRVYPDGRPDELIRGADMVGTPLSAFETIVAAGDAAAVFNGMCGAESGWVPVSAVSPPILLRKVEIERGTHERERPPLLPPPEGPGR